MSKRYLLLVHVSSGIGREAFERHEADQVSVIELTESYRVETYYENSPASKTFHAIKTGVALTEILPNPSKCILIHDRDGLSTNMYPHDF